MVDVGLLNGYISHTRQHIGTSVVCWVSASQRTFVWLTGC